MHKGRSEYQRAKYGLIRWRYYERNIQSLEGYAQINALTFFRSLKRLDPTEITWLAERYYKSTIERNFDEKLGDYETVKPIEFKMIAERFDTTVLIVQRELRRIERKLGLFIIDYSEEIKQEKASQDLDTLEHMTLSKVKDTREREILADAFHQIKQLRKKSDH